MAGLQEEVWRKCTHIFQINLCTSLSLVSCAADTNAFIRLFPHVDFLLNSCKKNAQNNKV
jgi:hypothetical protein